jgi:transposase
MTETGAFPGFFVKESLMAARSARRHSPPARTQTLHKPRGHCQARVQQVGPEHFGIVSVDCAKARSKWMLADFYGKVLIPPTMVGHNRAELDAMIVAVRAALPKHQIRDLLVAIERTGRYHHVIRDAFGAAGFETRIVHPHATKHFRQPADPGNKTDDTDLSAIHRAAVNGFALVEAPLDLFWQTLQLLARHRRDLVHKTSALACQVREHLDATWPGYTTCFDDFWESAIALPLVRQFETPSALLQRSLTCLCQHLRQQGLRFHQATVEAVLAWAQQAAPGDLAAALHRRLALNYADDRHQKNLEIQALERELAQRLAQTPYVLLLSFPGVNVVSAAEFAGEMGPIAHYANPRAITGRAGLFPSRYQSDQVDRPNGPLVRRAHRRLRTAILSIADNLIGANQHFRVLAQRWRALGKDSRHTHVKLAFRFCRIAYHMVAGRQVFRHPCLQGRHYILDKLLAFHREHQTPWDQVLPDLDHALEQVPPKEHRAEARPLAERLEELQTRRHGPRPPQLLCDILAVVLARLVAGRVQSTGPGEADPA